MPPLANSIRRSASFGLEAQYGRVTCLSGFHAMRLAFDSSAPRTGSIALSSRLVQSDRGCCTPSSLATTNGSGALLRLL